MEDSTCVNCNLPFETRKKGFKRKSITKLGIPLIKLIDILDKKVKIPCTPSEKLFLCTSCASLTVKLYKHSENTLNKGKTSKICDSKTEKKRKHTVLTPVKITPLKLTKRKCLTSTPKFKQTNETTRPSYLQKLGFKEKVIQNLKISRYDRVFKLLFKHSKSARNALMKVIGKAIKKEVKNAKIPSFQKPADLDAFNTFSWGTATKELSGGLPLLTTFLQESLCKKNKKAVVDDQGKFGPLVPVLGFIMGTILYIQKPLQHNFLQTIASIEMYRSGCNQKIFRWFQKLGWCKGIKGTRLAVDRICTEFDTNIKTWKSSIELELGHHAEDHRPDMDQPAMPESDSELSDSDRPSSDSDSLESEVILSSEEDADVVPLPSDEDADIVPLPLDNSSLAEEDRQDQNPGYSICWDNVQKLSISRHHLRQENRMMLWALCFAAKNRISFRHLDGLNDKCSVRDIQMHNYLPSAGDWQLLRCRMEHVVKTILCKYIPQFSDIHVEDITHQYSEISERKSEIVNLGVIQENPSSARGTLEILKILHQYVPIGEDDHPYPILCHGDQLSVERMVEAKLFMAFSEDPDDQLTGLIPRPQGFHKRCIILQDSMNMLFDGRSVGDKGSLCHIKNKFGFRTVKKKISDCINSVVDFFNFVTEACVCMIACKILNINDIDDIIDALPHDKTDRHTFFNELCEKVVKLAWPQVDKESIRQVTVVADDTQESTEDQDLFLDDTVIYWEDGHELEDTLPYYDDSEDEFDEPEAEVQDSGDSVFNYSRCLLCRGLLHMVQTNAERCNNGDHMISDWRMDMVEFWNRNHNKYLILGHRLLAGVSGCLPSRLREEVIWNSTANLVGKPGHNIALDLVNEFLNNEFKSNLRNCHGQYTDAQVSRCSKIVGSVGKAIEEIFYSEVVKDFIPKAAATDGTSKTKINKFIREYREEDLFTDKGDRHHTGFHNFDHKIEIKNPEKLHARLQKYVKNLENEEYIYN